jgi:hypothetical protein
MNSEEKKSLKKEFRQTQNGKKSFITYLIFAIIFLVTLVLYYVLMNVVDEDMYDTVRWTATIVFVSTAYFEGEYVGAMKQYIIEHTKK